MEVIQIYLLISWVIAKARLEMTVGSKPITSLFTVSNSAMSQSVDVSGVTNRGKSLLSSWGQVKDKANGNRMSVFSF